MARTPKSKIQRARTAEPKVKRGKRAKRSTLRSTDYNPYQQRERHKQRVWMMTLRRRELEERDRVCTEAIKESRSAWWSEYGKDKA